MLQVKGTEIKKFMVLGNKIHCDKCKIKTEHYVSEYNDIVKCKECGNEFRI